MEFEINISSEIKFKIENILANPDEEDWNNASVDEQMEYLRNQVKEYLLDNINELIEDCTIHTSITL